VLNLRLPKLFFLVSIVLLYPLLVLGSLFPTGLFPFYTPFIAIVVIITAYMSKNERDLLFILFYFATTLGEAFRWGAACVWLFPLLILRFINSSVFAETVVGDLFDIIIEIDGWEVVAFYILPAFAYLFFSVAIVRLAGIMSICTHIGDEKLITMSALLGILGFPAYLVFMLVNMHGKITVDAYASLLGAFLLLIPGLLYFYNRRKGKVFQTEYITLLAVLIIPGITLMQSWMLEPMFYNPPGYMLPSVMAVLPSSETMKWCLAVFKTFFNIVPGVAVAMVTYTDIIVTLPDILYATSILIAAYSLYRSSFSKDKKPHNV